MARPQIKPKPIQKVCIYCGIEYKYNPNANRYAKFKDKYCSLMCYQMCNKTCNKGE